MRVLFCQTVLHLPDERGGGPVNTDALCRAIRAQGHDAAILCGRRKSAIRWPLAFGANAFPYTVLRSGNPLNDVADAVRSFKPDIAIVQFADAPAMVQRLSQLGVPSIVYQHDAYAAEEVQRGAAGYFACSQAVADSFPRDLKARVDVVPVLIDPAAYRVARKGSMITLVNPIPRKGVEIAFALAARRPDLTFQLVEAWRLRNRVRDHLHSRAAHHGNVKLRAPGEDMRPVYESTRLILAPSLWREAWGRVISEAQVSGIPALVSDSGGLPEAVGEGGLVVPRDAPVGAWSDALDRLLDAPSYAAFSAAALAHASRPGFQPGAVTSRFLDLLEEHRR